MHALKHVVPPLAAATLVLATALPASAHVSVSSPDAEAGGFGKLVLRVPSESDTARTTGLTVQLPRDTPFAFVSTKPVPGWTVRTTERTLPEPVETDGFTLTKAVDTVTWTATEGGGLGPHEFAELELSVGPFPKADTLSFPATQRYSDGTSVAWDEATPASGEEPEHPAPTLELAADETPATAAATSSDDDGLARWLGAGGLALGAAALAVAVTGRRSRSSAPATTVEQPA